MSNSINLCNFDNQNEINKRILLRNIPTCKNTNLVDFRPEMTKYNFPIITNNKLCSNIEKINFQEDECFNDFFKNIDVESNLKNYSKSLSNNPNDCYIPKSTSELYSYTIEKKNNTAELLYPDLFNKNNIFYSQNSKNVNIGYNTKLFNTSTRYEMKN